MPKDYIYLDYNATTPVAPEVLDAMLPFLREDFGNPSSPHPLGKRAHDAVEAARVEVAGLIGAKPEEIIFTSSGTESNNLALWGPVLAGGGGGHIVVSKVEHPAILNPALFMEERGVGVSFAPVDSRGLVNPADVASLLRADSVVASVMHSNNETGVLQPVAEIARLAREKGVLMHTDAAQSAGKVPVSVDELGVDLLTIVGHKLYAPKGIGALYVRDGVELSPLIRGGGQERGLSPGTENVPYMVGLGAAARLAGRRLEEEMARLKGLRDLLEGLLREGFPSLAVHSEGAPRLPNTLSAAFPGIPGQEILERCPRIFASTGAACHEDTVSLSHVLAAMGVSPEVGMGTVRLTLGRQTTKHDVTEAAAQILAAAGELSP